MRHTPRKRRIPPARARTRKGRRRNNRPCNAGTDIGAARRAFARKPHRSAPRPRPSGHDAAARIHLPPSYGASPTSHFVNGHATRPSACFAAAQAARQPPPAVARPARPRTPHGTRRHPARRTAKTAPRTPYRCALSDSTKSITSCCECRSILRYTLLIWLLTVSSPMVSSAAMNDLLRPRASKNSTSTSRGDRR